jgi:hypothetical protein
VKVFLLHHLHLLGDEEGVKLIGVYSTEERARGAANRLASQPGFSDFPTLWPDGLLADDGEARNGFEISAYEIDTDHWTEGYVTVGQSGSGGSGAPG